MQRILVLMLLLLLAPQVAAAQTNPKSPAEKVKNYGSNRDQADALLEMDKQDDLERGINPSKYDLFDGISKKHREKYPEKFGDSDPGAN